MIKSFHKLLLCLIFLPGVTSVFAQYRIDRWTADDGLPQNSVYGIVQTDDGYLWMATLDGLARFDGVRFTVFNKSNSPGIVNNRFISLFKDIRGDLWAGTEARGIIRYHNGSFSNYPLSLGRMINSINADPNGNPVISVSESTIVHFSGEEFTTYDSQTVFHDNSLTAQKQNIRLVCTPDPNAFQGSCILDGKPLNFSPEENINNNKLRAAVRDAGGDFWLVNNKDELVRVENGKVIRNYDEADGLPQYPLDFVAGAKIYLVSWDGKDSLWLTDLTTMRNELLVKIPVAVPQQADDIYPPYRSGASIFQSSFQDSEGNLWFGTRRGGLYRARKQIVNSFRPAKV